ncbi:C40 family peptidase [Azoarcus sp. KH32C]|uniref:C40 family peptidase n=1 Tax=Azoarcus sp. KH32C TaxID=748247 RepID=UPI0002386C71|nr:C40 family peptidase [Azoarcus sp. KH32C]BAL24374.1 lipoprotein, NlpC/P60 family [Azoarcus sp. KH32C]
MKAATRQAGRKGLLLILTLLLAACSSVPTTAPVVGTPAPSLPEEPRIDYFAFDDPLHSREMVMVALGLLDTGYAFGGRNPEAGLDCSGMVSYVVEQVSGRRLPHNASKIAEITRPIPVSSLQPGDLVFFNTMNRRHSHMGIYLGEGKFVHAPSTRGRVRVERLDSPYFAPRVDGARTLLATS